MVMSGDKFHLHPIFMPMTGLSLLTSLLVSKEIYINWILLKIHIYSEVFKI